MDLQPFAELVTPTGCTELVSSCRALAYTAGAGVSAMRVPGGGFCCCPTMDGDYGPTPADDPAPWYDEGRPESAQFFGLHGSLTVGVAAASGVSLTGVVAGEQRVTFTGLLLASSDAGRLFGWRWLAGLLDSCGAAGCVDWMLRVRAHCPPATPVPVEWPNPRPTVVDPCDDGPVALGEPPALPEWADDPTREIPVRYVPGSLQETASDWPSCYGTQVTFSFDVTGRHWFGTPTYLVDYEHDTWDGDCCECHQVTWCDPTTSDGCDRCGDPTCRCGPPAWSTEGTHAQSHRPVGAEACAWSAPLCWKRATFITPALPFDVVPIVEFRTGQDPVDVLVRMWDAHPALADPATCAGSEWYGSWPMCGTAAVRIPAGSVVTLDGRTGTAALFCDGGTRPAGHLVSGCGSGGLVLPVVGCGHRVWVAVDTDCYQPPGVGFRMRAWWAQRESL